jgi:hypothetical protein
MKPNQHINATFYKQTDQAKSGYRTRLNAFVDCIRFLLRKGLAFRGHDKSKNSSNKRNFLELLQFLANHNETINNVALKNSPKNLKLVTPKIQKDIVNTTYETANAIIKDLGDKLFSILVDESHDISTKEQMAVVLWYADNTRIVTERFIGIMYVTNTTQGSN